MKAQKIDHFKLILIPTLALVTVFSSCGKEEEELFQYQGEGEYSHISGEIRFPGKFETTSLMPVAQPTLTPEERKEYCVIYTKQESDEQVRTEVLAQLEGKWKISTQKIRELSDPAPTYVRFDFSLAQNFAKLWSGEIFFKTDEEIHFDQLCLSKELIRNDPFNGFRILELSAKNNDGVAAFAFKIIHPSQGKFKKALLMTHREYFRYGSKESVRTDMSIFAPDHPGERSTRITVFPLKD